MSSNVAIALISSLSSGGFVLLGVGASNWLAIRREEQGFRRETALELARTEQLVWADDWTELTSKLGHVGVRLTVSGVDDELVRAFHDISVLCWRDRNEEIEMTGNTDAGINGEFTDARRDLQEAVLASLLRRAGREELRRQAVQNARAILSNPENRRYV